MLNGLPDEMIRELREEYPRTQIPELLGRVAAFKRECFAGAKYLGREIGRSPRQVFRYFRRLKDDGVIIRVPGSRRFDSMPVDAEKPAALRAHGFATTQFRGEMAQRVHRGRSIVDSRKSRRKLADERREQERRERRAAEALEHELYYAAKYPAPTTEPRTPQPTKRAPVSDAERQQWAAKYPDPRQTNYEAVAIELEVFGGCTYETGPPD